MRFAALATSLFALVGSALSQTTSDPGITSPASLTTCQPASFTVSGTNPPFLIAVIPGGQVSASPLENLPQVNAAGSFTWNVNLAAGTNVTVRVTDSKGTVGYSSPIVIQAGTSTACVGSSASITQNAGATASSATVAGLTSTTTTSPPSSTSSSAGGAAAGGASSSAAAAPASTSSRSGAASKTVAGSALGLIGAALLAVMA